MTTPVDRLIVFFDDIEMLGPFLFKTDQANPENFMADAGSESETLWPTPKFSFEVRWDSAVMHFQEVTRGLDSESQPIEYRRAGNSQFAVVMMPGLEKHDDVTLKKGVAIDDDKFWDWFNAIKTNSVERKRITISMLDESGTPTMVWTLTNAWPTQVSGIEPKSQGNKVLVETMVIAHEGFTISMV